MSVRKFIERSKHSVWTAALLALAGACSDGAAAPQQGAAFPPQAGTPSAQPATGMSPAMASGMTRPPVGGAVSPMPMTPPVTGMMMPGQVMPPVGGGPGMMTPGMMAPMMGAAGADAPMLNGMQTVVPDPSWTCNMPDGIPPPEMGEMVMEVEFMLGEVYDIGETQFGHRVLTEIKGGTLKGKVEGTFLSRGLDWQLTLPTGSVEVEQVNIFQAQGGTVYFRNCGVSPKGGEKVLIVPDFEAPNSGALSFLNTGKFAGYREFDMAKKTMKMTIYDIAMVTAPAEKIAIQDPDAAELPNQTWECKKPGGTRGGVYYTESVGIGSPIMVGASKRGTRNIIPITGGTTTGKLAGTVLDGGADFQLLGGGFELDARYTAKTDDGELIIIRNCGGASNLIPVFEAKKDGKYAYVAKNHYFSSTPSPTGCCVNITIYEGGEL